MDFKRKLIESCLLSTVQFKVDTTTDKTISEEEKERFLSLVNPKSVDLAKSLINGEFEFCLLHILYIFSSKYISQCKQILCIDSNSFPSSFSYLLNNAITSLWSSAIEASVKKQKDIIKRNIFFIISLLQSYFYYTQCFLKSIILKYYSKYFFKYFPV